MSNLLSPEAAAAAFIKLDILNECAKPFRPAAGLYIRWFRWLLAAAAAANCDAAAAWELTDETDETDEEVDEDEADEDEEEEGVVEVDKSTFVEFTLVGLANDW